MKESAILKPSDTIIFGEKKNDHSDPNNPVAMDYYMDILEGNGNDFDRVEHGCHSVNAKTKYAGGSNFTMVDGSVRYFKFGTSVWPLNQWCNQDKDRLTYAFKP